MPMMDKGWVALGLLLVAGGLLVSCGGGGEEVPTQTSPVGLESRTPPPVIQNGAGMAVDAVSGASVDANRTVTETPTFDVDVVVDKAVSGYQGYQYMIQWDPAVLAYEGQEDLKPEGLELCAEPTPRENTIYGGCARISENTNFTGPIHKVSFRCVAEGTSPLHLVSLTENEHFGSTILGFAGVTIDTDLTDASVTCQGVAEAPAAAPVTPTPEGGGPSSS